MTKPFSLLLHNCDFATPMNYNENIPFSLLSYWAPLVENNCIEDGSPLPPELIKGDQLCEPPGQCWSMKLGKKYQVPLGTPAAHTFSPQTKEATSLRLKWPA